ncbi:unnamed protein product [Arabidopsis lyrata]|nr:unnamed protein product [Arabidopsis lyrata]
MDVHVSYMLGDDCVAITGGRGGSSDINITGVACGPGHGISIGSLGKDDETDDIVENVIVRSCSFTGTQNGARIKTWQENAVKVNNITFRYFEGTSSSEIAIKLDCDETENCQNITMEHINITSPTPGLVLNGSGILHPHGEAWWSSIEHSHRPRTIGFNGSSNIIYNGLTQMNSPKNHISILNCTNVTLSNFHLIAPKDSPNTDGIDIALSNNIRIFNSSIQTGDDCVAINGGSYDINITHVACGPGHGISIGSLGRGGENDTVQNVKVRHCSFNGTKNGARIKTWTATTAVKVSNVTFRYFKGTCANNIAIKLDCDEVTGCQDIVMEHINITSSSTNMPLTAYCQFADIVSHFVSMHIKCGFNEEPLVPVRPPRHVEPPTPPTKPPTMFPKPLAPAKPPVYYAKPPVYYAKPPAPNAQPLAPNAQPPMLSFLSYFI